MAVSGLDPSRHGPPMLECTNSGGPVMNQIGWLGHSRRVYGLDEDPSRTENGGFTPLYIQTGTWEDLGEGRLGIKD